MRHAHPPRSPRTAYTLAELLIVMTIMLMLVAITLPAIKNVMQDGNTREASRLLNAYFQLAKSRALQTGRPCGVMMICDLPLGISEPPPLASGNPRWPTKLVNKLYLAEVPPPYSGSFLGARGRIMASGAGTFEFYPLVAGGIVADSTEMTTIGSLIANLELFFVRFEFKGQWYLCQRVDSGGNIHFIYQGTTQSGSSLPNPPSMSPYGYSYQIVRLPRRIGNPLELTPGTCIDVVYSGIGPTDIPQSDLNFGMYPAPGTVAPASIFPLRRITLMFSPTGGVDGIFLNDYAFAPSTTTHFLIGRTDKINPPFPVPSGGTYGTTTSNATGYAMYDPALSNLADSQNLWVSVARSTGNVLTSDNQPPLIDPKTATPVQIYLFTGTPQQQILDPSTSAAQVTFLAYCRQLATNREQAKAQ